MIKIFQLLNITNDKHKKYFKYFGVFMLVILAYYLLKNFIFSTYNKVKSQVLIIGNTLSDERAQILSDELENLIQGHTTVSDEVEIVDILQPLSLQDYYKVSNYFGLHKYSDDIGDFIPYVPFIEPDTLSQILAYELQNEQRILLQQKNSTIYNLLFGNV